MISPRLGGRDGRQTMQGRKLLLYELNEVPFRIFDHFARLRPNSTLDRLSRRARRYKTYSEDSGHLSPWVTWPTVHRGITNFDHEISHFGQDLGPVNKEFPPLWSILTENGVRCGVFGSLHSYPVPESLDNYAFYVPDTFAAGPECFPKGLEAFQRFNLAMVDGSGLDAKGGIALKQAVDFLRAAPGLGLRARTVAELAKQLAEERIKPRRVVRRRTSQVQIAFDFFMHGLKRDHPEMAFFFTNHVASSMHRYWPALFPEDYDTLRFDEDWLATWSGEIPFVMREAGAQLEELIRFVDVNQDYSLIVAGSMGQAAVQYRERTNTVLTLKDHAAFARLMGLAPGEWSKERAMAPQFVFRIAPPAVERFVQSVGGFTINGEPQKVTRLGLDRVCVDIGAINLKDAEIDIGLKGQRYAPADLGLVNLSLQDAAGANAYHIPEGMCLVYEPGAPEAADSTPRPVSTTEIAPSILANFGIRCPGYMEAALPL